MLIFNFLVKILGCISNCNIFISSEAVPLHSGCSLEISFAIVSNNGSGGCFQSSVSATLQKVREASGDRYSYSIDYEIVTKLKAFSDTYGVCLLLVHHTRKLESEDNQFCYRFQ